MKRPSNTLRSSRMEERPLAGLRVLVGRARLQASALSAELRRRGAEVIEIPFIEIRKPRSYRPLDTALKHLHDYDWLILTSVNGAEAMWQRISKLGLTKASLKHLRIAAIGPATKQAIEMNGLKVNVVPREYVAESVVRRLRNRVQDKRVLLVRAKVARDVIPRELRAADAKVDVVEAYETVVPQASRARLGAVLRNPRLRPDFITFTSSSTVRNFMTLLTTHKASRIPTRFAAANQLKGIRCASIGPVTAATLRKFSLPVDVEAKVYTIPGLVQAIVDAVSPHQRFRAS
jgi:uroporphyrinogen-III synthase